MYMITDSMLSVSLASRLCHCHLWHLPVLSLSDDSNDSRGQWLRLRVAVMHISYHTLDSVSECTVNVAGWNVQSVQ